MPFQVTSYHGPSLQGVLPKGGSATGTFQTDTTSSQDVFLFQDLSLLVCAIPLQLENETEVVPSTFAASGFPVGIAFRLSNGFASTFDDTSLQRQHSSFPMLIGCRVGRPVRTLRQAIAEQLPAGCGQGIKAL